MPTNSERYAWAGWILAGLPIISSSLRAASALTGTNLVAPIPIAGQISVALQEMAVFVVAQDIAFRQVSLVLGFFLLILTSWLAFGVLMITGVRRRIEPSSTVAAGAVTVASVLYLILFFGVYNGLLTTDLPVGQLAAFFAVPVVASGLLVGSYYIYPWEDERYWRAIKDLKEAEKAAGRKRREFDDRLSEEIGGDPSETSLLPDELAFPAECREIENRAERIRNTSSAEPDLDDLQRRAQGVKLDAMELDPEEALQTLRTELEAQVREAAEQKIGKLRLETPDGEQLEVENLPREYTHVPTEADVDIVLSSQRSVSEQIIELRTANQLTIIEAIRAIDDVVDHVQTRVAPHVESQIRLLAPHVESWSTEDESGDDMVEQRTTIVERFEAIEGLLGKSLYDIYVDGNDGTSELVSVADVREAVDEAENSVRRCTATDLEETVRWIDGMVASLQTAVDYYDRTFYRGLKEEREQLSLYARDATPEPVFDEHVFETLKQSVAKDFGAEYEIDWTAQTLTVTYDAGANVPSDDQIDVGDGAAVTDTTSASEDVEWRVHSLLDKITERSRDNEQVVIDRDELPSGIDESAISAFKSFVDTHDELVVREEAEESPERGFVVETSGGSPLEQVTRDLRDDFSAWNSEQNDHSNITN
ncbi:hypothetical protein SAMN04487949_2923 [Halogranum gelatinilyticum]|uniref:Uncharacterized protein n=2 Tax=Halogranum gelatinilyticum TaxID=660521 RepID=A0A1G9XBK7_9EURY|nr:hypothetical protein SAMN04487949_2923 [Halogranum gelatinilyticum]